MTSSLQPPAVGRVKVQAPANGCCLTGIASPVPPLGRMCRPRSGAMALRRVDAGNGQVEVLALDAADNKNACDQSDMALHWLSHDKLIAAASCRSRKSASTRQWLLFDRDRKPRSSAGQDVQAEIGRHGIAAG